MLHRSSLADIERWARPGTDADVVATTMTAIDRARCPACPNQHLEIEDEWSVCDCCGTRWTTGGGVWTAVNGQLEAEAATETDETPAAAAVIRPSGLRSMTSMRSTR